MAVLLFAAALAGSWAPSLQDQYPIPVPPPVVAEKLVTQPEPSRHAERPTLYMEATYYTWTGCKTATGTWPQEGRTVAVDPKVIPLGSKLIINGQSGYVAEDTGGAIKDNVVDIYLSSYSQCVHLGRRQVTVEIIN